MTSEITPEAETTSFAYGSDATCGTALGSLVKRTDAMGNVTCYARNGWERLTGITHPARPYANAATAEAFGHDTATVDGTAMADRRTRALKAESAHR